MYVLPEFQQRGLGRFMMKCLNEVVEGWPDLRGVWILSSSPQARKLYEEVFGAVDFFASNKNPNLALLDKRGPRSPHASGSH